MDNVEIAEHFQQGGWVVIRDYCAPFNICEQLEKVDKMLGGDEEQRKVDVDNFVKKIGEQDMLFCHSDVESRWEAYKLTHDKKQLEIKAYFCMVMVLFGYFVLLCSRCSSFSLRRCTKVIP